MNQNGHSSSGRVRRRRAWTLAAVAAALFAGAGASSARTLDVYVVTGQSNALGTVQDSVAAGGTPIGSAPAEGAAPNGAPNVPFWFDNFHGYHDAADAALGASTAWTPPRVQPKGPYRYPFVGPEVGLARRLYDTGHRGFAIVKAARDGGGNTLWQRSSQPPKDGATAGLGVAYWKVVDAVRAATSTPCLASIGYDDFRLVGLLYLQGESNTAAEAADAGPRLAQLAADLRSDFAPRAAGLKVVACENLSTASTRQFGLAGWQHAAGPRSPSGITNEALRAWAIAHPATAAWVPTADLTIVNTDGLRIHADAQGELTLGRRAADAFVALSTVTTPGRTGGH